MEFILPIAQTVLLLTAIILIVILLNKKQSNNDSKEYEKQLLLLNQKLDIITRLNNEKLEEMSRKIKELTDKNYEQQIMLLKTFSESSQKQSQAVSVAIEKLQKSNEEKLESMRRTVDEKLEETLDKRLNSSFKAVSQQLSNVYKSLGEMKELSAGVTDSVTGLNRVLTNVKTRGTWAEVQLGNILDQTIPDMYETNVQTNPKYNGRVEFAIKIPNQDNNDYTYLPIDSKFPMEDYARLSSASQSGNLEALEKAKKALEIRVREEGKLIKQYISEPETTPFAIMYLATEGLYAEITASKNGLAEKLQADGILIAGPSTITALLNSLSMGFRTMAINKKANQVWKVLGAAKAQYEKFGTLIDKARKKVDEAGKALDEADHRNSVIQKNLRKIETLDSSQANDILGIED